MDLDRIGSTFVVVLIVIFVLIGLLTVVALIIVIARFRPPVLGHRGRRRCPDLRGVTDRPDS